MSTMTAVSVLGPVVALGAHPGGPWDGRWDGGGPGWWVVFPILWFLLVATVVVVVARRWRRAPWGAGAAGAGSGRTGSARAVLSERFARGEIDEAEYRTRLEVLLATEDRPT
ncbi:SHOCT domain-containing protein [uncultured Cellulomonas sp.]|uniref:SHOCT domain-containing protein n=1 Tax=uncultured Cellulomonas sp. TaxID=189682 RepID=UPI00262D023D|nr:SHOCT domain-containing protein [uncultured Cellulomonas sp.]